MDRVRRLSLGVLEKYRDDFGEDFADNKKTLDSMTIIRSKGLKNEIAGYITKTIKSEMRETREREAQERARLQEEEDAKRIAMEAAAREAAYKAAKDSEPDGDAAAAASDDTDGVQTAFEPSDDAVAVQEDDTDKSSGDAPSAEPQLDGSGPAVDDPITTAAAGALGDDPPDADAALQSAADAGVAATDSEPATDGATDRAGDTTDENNNTV